MDVDRDKIDSEQLIQELPIHLACFICFDLPKNPIQACTNLHDDPICKKCLSKYFETSMGKAFEEGRFLARPECPHCRAPLLPPVLWVPHRKIEDKLADLLFACSNGKKGRGCSWTGKRKEVTHHEKKCKYQPTQCPNYALGCRLPLGSPELLLVNIFDHLNNACPYAFIPCPRAKVASPANIRVPAFAKLTPLSSSHPRLDGLPPVHVRQLAGSAHEMCGPKGTGRLVRRKDLQTHEAMCPFWKCKYAKYGCEMMGTQNDLVNHRLSSDCSRIQSRLKQLLRPRELQIHSLTSDKTTLEHDNRKYVSQIELLEKTCGDLRANNGRLTRELIKKNQDLKTLRDKSSTPQTREIKSRKRKLIENKEDLDGRIGDPDIVMEDRFEQVGARKASGIGSGNRLGTNRGTRTPTSVASSRGKKRRKD